MIPYTPIKYYDLGFFKIDVEPVAMALAFIIFITLVILGLKKEKIRLDVKGYFLFFFIVLFSGLAGGRLWYFIANWQGPQTIIDIFNLMKPGLFSLGMYLGGAIGIAIYTLIRFKKEKKQLNFSITFARLADIIVAPTTLAIFIYRLFGCTVYGCTKGTPTNVPWCFLWPDGVCRHPVTLYLALSALLIFILLKVFFSREKTETNKFGKRFDGEVALWFLLLYFFNRFWIEFFVSGRNMGVEKYIGLSGVQWVCLMVFFGFLIHAADIYIIKKL